jgi:hypothetical protein
VHGGGDELDADPAMANGVVACPIEYRLSVSLLILLPGG